LAISGRRRQPADETGALNALDLAGFDFQRSAMALHNMAREIQAKPQASLVARFPEAHVFLKNLLFHA
jgi:hypothetical protein